MCCAARGSGFVQSACRDRHCPPRKSGRLYYKRQVPDERQTRWRSERDSNSRSLSPRESLFLAEEKEPEVDQSGLERRRPFSRGTSGSNPSRSHRRVSRRMLDDDRLYWMAVGIGVGSRGRTETYVPIALSVSQSDAGSRRASNPHYRLHIITQPSYDGFVVPRSDRFEERTLWFTSSPPRQVCRESAGGQCDRRWPPAGAGNSPPFVVRRPLGANLVAEMALNAHIFGNAQFGEWSRSDHGSVTPA